MPRRKNWRKSVSRREVLYGAVSINASPDQLQANGSPARCRQMEVLPNAGKWKSCQMQANGSPVQMQANGSPVQMQANRSPVQLQANGSPVQVQAMQNWQNCENTSETNANKKAKTSETNVKKRQKHMEKVAEKRQKKAKLRAVLVVV